jgi:acetyl esterase/lipase
LNNRGIERIAIAGDSAGGGLAESLVAAYVGSNESRDLRASPLYGNLTGLPAVQIIVGDAETLRGFSRRASVVCLG